MAISLSSASSLPITMSAPSEPAPTLLARLASPLGTSRARKQAALFFAGATFCFLSAAVTRRALQRRALVAAPRRFTPSNEPNSNFSGPVEAVEALGIASASVVSGAMMMTGGALWAWDVSTIDELRKKVRGGLGVGGLGLEEKEVEEDFEEWMASVLSRKERKEMKKSDEAERAGGKESER